MDSYFEGGDVPELIGHWRLEKVIGSGGMGVVYFARDVDPEYSHRHAAVKIFKPSSDGFEKVIATAIISGKGLASIFETGTFTDRGGRSRHYMVMQFINGAKSLTAFADENRLGLRERISLLLQLAEAVDTLNELGIVHHDIKPSNVLVDDKGTVYLTDFGLARLIVNYDPAAPGFTLDYAAPEQLDPGPSIVLKKCDIYSLGVTAYQLIEGRLPRQSGEGLRPHEWAGHIKVTDARPMGAPSFVRAWVVRAISPNPNDRQETVMDLRRQMERSISLLGRAPLLAAVLLAIAAACSLGLAGILGGQATSRWTNLRGWWETAVMSGPGGGLDSPLQAVAIILVDEVGVSRADRGMHARMCAKLSDSGAKAVGIDFIFQNERPGDDELAAGFDALSDAGIGVVLAERSCSRVGGNPVLSPKLLGKHVETGFCDFGGLIDAPSVALPLLCPNDGVYDEPKSFALALYLRAVTPRAMSSARYAAETRSIDVDVWSPDASRPGGRVQLGRLQLPSGFDVASYDSTAGFQLPGLADGRSLPLLYGGVSSPQFFRPATYDFNDVLTWSSKQLKDAFADRVVIVAPDHYGTIGGARVLLPSIHATFVEQLIAGRLTTASKGRLPIASAGFGAGTGIAICLAACWTGSRGWAHRGTRTMRPAVGIAVCIVSAVGLLLYWLAMAAYRRRGDFVDPSDAVIAMLLTVVTGVPLVVWSGVFFRVPTRRRPKTAAEPTV